MSADPLRVFMDAKTDYDSKMAEVQDLTKLIDSVAQALRRNPLELMVANVSNVGFPMEVALRQGVPSLDANRWPSGQRIAEVLTAAHAARKRARDTYYALPEAERRNLPEPK